MAHLIKMLMKTTTIPTKISQRCCTTRLLTTTYFLNTHAETYTDTSDCVTENEVNVPEKQQSDTWEKPYGKFSKTKSKAVRLKQSTLRKVRSVVGLSVTPFAVGWAKMDMKEMRLKACFTENLHTEGMDITESLACRMMKDVVKQIPSSDVYIMESCKVYKKKFKDVNEIQTMLSSMLAIQLYDPNGPLGEDNVFFQNKSVIDHLYKLTVNWERVSAGQVLQRLLGSTVATKVMKNEGNNSISIIVKGVTLSTTSNVMQAIFSSSPCVRDASAVAFFVALSFVQANLKSFSKFHELPTPDTNLNCETSLNV